MFVGIKPCWVFDGTLPSEKSRILTERKTKKESSKGKIKIALKGGDISTAYKYSSQVAYIISDD